MMNSTVPVGGNRVNEGNDGKKKGDCVTSSNVVHSLGSRDGLGSQIFPLLSTQAGLIKGEGSEHSLRWVDLQKN